VLEYKFIHEPSTIGLSFWLSWLYWTWYQSFSDWEVSNSNLSTPHIDLLRKVGAAFATTTLQAQIDIHVRRRISV